MRRGKSLRRELAAVSLGSALLVVGVYTALLPFYFETGLREAVTILSNIEAASFDDALRSDPETPLPRFQHARVYLGYASLPEYIKHMFPPTAHEHGRMIGNEEEGDQDLVLMVPYDLHDGQRLYLVWTITDEHVTRFGSSTEEGLDYLTWGTTLVFTLILLLTMYLVNNRVTHQMHRLSDWAAALDLENQSNPRPRFGYDELNVVADQLQLAFRRIGEILAREQRFLRFASHELRTPLMVIEANMELLDRQLGDGVAGYPGFARIRRSARSMRRMVETLLWLSRSDAPADTAVERLNLSELVRELLDEHRHLLERKRVTVRFESADAFVMTIRSSCSIALSNLIRNAFQYTDKGTVDVAVEAGRFSICNVNDTDHPPATGHGDNFGLGLVLVETVAERMGWRYSVEILAGGRCAMIEFRES